ncbi:MAG: lipopolysaccharide transport periplasmic protein LptA [Thermodesulfovibrionales bacterium]
MSKRLFISSLLLLALAAAGHAAETSKVKTQGPITVTADSLVADNKNHTAAFEKNVIAKTSDMTIYADTMLVYYREDGGEVTKIEAVGSVKLLKETKVITAQKAVYIAAEEKVILTGEPRAMDGDNVVTGSKMTFFIKDDRSVVENSKVFLKSKKDK